MSWEASYAYCSLSLSYFVDNIPPGFCFLDVDDPFSRGNYFDLGFLLISGFLKRIRFVIGCW